MRSCIHKKGSESIPWSIVQIASVLLALSIVGYLVTHINATREHGNAITGAALEVARTGFEVRDITGFSTDANYSEYEGVIVTVRPLKGGEGINLEKSVIYIQVGNRTARLHIVNGTTERDAGSGFFTE